MARLEQGIARGALALGLLSTAACTSEAEQPVDPPITSTGAPAPGDEKYPLKKDGEWKVSDQKIKDEKPNKGVKSITIFLDPQHKEGSIRTKVCFDVNNLPKNFRFVTYEEAPRPGGLGDFLYETKKEINKEINKEGCIIKDPVIQTGENDRARIHIGVGNSSEESYKDMYSYHAAVNKFDLKGWRLDNTTIKPPVELRRP